MKDGCRQLGLDVEAITATQADFERIRCPAIAHYRPPGELADPMGHYVVVLALDDHWVHFLDANYAGGKLRIPRGDFFRQWSGRLLVSKDARTVRRSWIATAGYVVLATQLAILGIVAVRMVSARRQAAADRSAAGLHVLLAFLVFSVLEVGCSRQGDGSTPAPPPRNRGFDLTAWKTEEDVGPIPENGDAEAEFVIENTGAVDVKLDAGQPTCSCSSLALDKRSLAPGESARLRMKMRGEGKPGFSQTSVAIMAVGQKWANTFRVRATVPGLRLPDGKLVVTEEHAVAPLRIRGEFFSERAEEPFGVTVTCEGAQSRELQGLFKVGRAEVSAAKPAGRCFVRDVVIPVSLVSRTLPASDRTRSGNFVVKVSRGSAEKTYSIAFELAPSLTPSDRRGT